MELMRSRALAEDVDRLIDLAAGLDRCAGACRGGGRSNGCGSALTPQVCLTDLLTEHVDGWRMRRIDELLPLGLGAAVTWR
jgi:hypothetical protein